MNNVFVLPVNSSLKNADLFVGPMPSAIEMFLAINWAVFGGVQQWLVNGTMRSVC